MSNSRKKQRIQRKKAPQKSRRKIQECCAIDQDKKMKKKEKEEKEEKEKKMDNVKCCRKARKVKR
jgi:hypothetical protein